MPIVILGMHRSGTSLVARVLLRMGVDMGGRFQVPDETNPDGYFEDLDFQELNKEILKEAGGSWNHLLTKRWILGKKVRKKFQARARALVAEKSATPRPWGWKDPRNCMTAWFWHPLLDGPAYLVVDRDFGEVAKSLARVHGKEPRDWAPLIKHYRQHVGDFLMVHDPPVLRVRYGDLVDRGKARAALEAIAGFVGTGEDAVDDCMEFIRFREG